MKIRLGFVSNSSSASFCLNRAMITKKQYTSILNFAQVARQMVLDGKILIYEKKKNGFGFHQRPVKYKKDKHGISDSVNSDVGYLSMEENVQNDWSIKELADGDLECDTTMDNFDLRNFCINVLGISVKAIYNNYSDN